MGRFSFLSKTARWRDIPDDSGYLWDGEAAASLLSNYLESEALEIYTILNRSDLMSKLRIYPDPKGPISVYNQFWKNDLYPQRTVHPLLIYAYLMPTNIGRNMKAATVIREEQLKSILE